MFRLWIPIVPERISKSIDPKEANLTFQTTRRWSTAGLSGRGVQEVELRRVGGQHDVFRRAPERPADLPDVPERRRHVAGHGGRARWPPAQASPRRRSNPRGRVRASPGRLHADRLDQLGSDVLRCGGLLGDPILRDARFHSALNWAVDARRIVEHRLRRLRGGGTTIVRRASSTTRTGTGSHRPPRRTRFDPARAKAELDAAGSKDPDGNGLQE